FLPLQPLTTTYGWAYFISNPILWILSYFVVLELFRLILEDYPGISSAGRKAVTWSMGIAVIVSAISVVPDLRSAHATFPFLRLFYTVERSVILALLLFLVLIQLFLARYRLNLSRNRKLYASGYALYFGTAISSDIILTELLGGRAIDWVSLSLVMIADVILLSGAVLLKREGEVRVKLDPANNTADQLRLHRELAEINRMLTRVARS